MKKFTGRVMLGLAAAMMLLLTGCGEKQCFFVTQDSKGLREGAPVIWSAGVLAQEYAVVGKVVSLEETDGGTKVSIKFTKKYKELIHDGVAGRVVVDEKSSPPKVGVLLSGGRDKKQPILENGDQIPESKQGNVVKEGWREFVNWLKNSRLEELKIVCYILVALVLVLKYAGKLFKLAAFIGILCAIGYVCVTLSSGWSNYRERLSNVQQTAQEAKAWLQKHGEKLHTILETALEADE